MQRRLQTWDPHFHIIDYRNLNATGTTTMLQQVQDSDDLSVTWFVFQGSEMHNSVCIG